MDWCFKIKGNYSYLKSILYKELDSIKNPLEKNIKDLQAGKFGKKKKDAKSGAVVVMKVKT